MATKKATSSRTPAVARKSAPQPQSRRTAAKRHEPRESRGPSETVVREPAKPLQGLVGLNQVPAAKLPLLGKPNPILEPPGSKLLRHDPDPHEHQSLPFVSEDDSDKETHYWQPELPASLAVQAELGKRYGAAFALFISRNGRSALPLSWILTDMFHGAKIDYVAQNFFMYLDEMLFDLSHYLSPKDIEEHVEAVIADDRRYYEPQDLVEVGA